MVKHVGKKGDTLVEVTLAVGIFSMVAISIVSVINGSTSSAQTALEATLAREEIDAQAEALRFIHDSASLDAPNGPYITLWTKITDPLNTLSADDTDRYLSNYPPTTCGDLYSGSNAISDKAFVVDTHKLSSINASTDPEEAANDTIKQNSGSSSLFQQAATYPHLVYTYGSTDNVGSLVEEGTDDSLTLKRVDGIYVLAVKDKGTNIVGKKDPIPAYYDFYIRTCWYGAGERKASTISTVIRLNNPDATKKSE